MATSSANNHHTLDPFLLYLSSSVIFPGLPLAPHTQATPNKKSILSTRQCHHNYSSQTAIEDKLHLHCLFTRSPWLNSSPLPSAYRLSVAPWLKPGWRHGRKGHNRRWQKSKRSGVRDHGGSSSTWNSFSLSVVAHISGRSTAAHTTLFLPEHSPHQRFQCRPVARASRKSQRFAYVLLEFHFSATAQLKLRAASSSVPRRASSGESNLAVRWEENHFPCLHEYRTRTPQKTLQYWFFCL